MSTNAQPKTPAEWKAYASLKPLLAIPGTANGDEGCEREREIHRNIYLDGTRLIKQPLGDCQIYTDVLAFGEHEVTLSPGDLTTVQINARVLTADQPVHLNMSKTGAKRCSILIFAAVVDQPFSVSVEGSQRTILDLGANSGHFGVEVDFQDGQLSVTYQEQHSYDASNPYRAFLDTELRIALALFWQRPGIAISICSYVAQSTFEIDAHSLSNAQAVSLGQQLAARAMAGPNANYAPTLPFKTYQQTMLSQLAAAKTFEKEYQRFQDEENAVADKKAAWATMLQHAQDQRSTLVNVQAQALSKYEDACVTAQKCSKKLDDDDEELRHAQDAFEDGLVAWKDAQLRKAVLGILTAIFQFASGVATMYIGNNPVESTKQVETAIDSVEKAEKGAKQVGQILGSSTLGKLWAHVKSLQKLYPQIKGLVEAARAIANLPDGDKVKIPSLNQISGSSRSDVDATLISSLAAWDDWALECDQQMEWAADDQKIGGASEYRLVLRKHAVHGRAVAHVQAEAIKQGQQYVQATLEVLQSGKDIENLQKLLQRFDGEKDIYAAAKAKFYDRFAQLKTGLAIQLQYIVDAYRFYALENSRVILDSQKTVGDFEKDLATLQTEMQNVDGAFAQDFQPFKPVTYSDELASNFHQLVTSGLKDSSQHHTAAFTLVATATSQAASKAGEGNFAYPFAGGTHYRLDGLEILLKGVKPRPEAVRDGRAFISFKIETSGSYCDIRCDNEIFYFVSPVHEKRYSYEIDAHGNFLRTWDAAIFESKNHAEPTPFTQWTITLETPQSVDLNTIDKLELHWAAKYRPYCHGLLSERGTQ